MIRLEDTSINGRNDPRVYEIVDVGFYLLDTLESIFEISHQSWPIIKTLGFLGEKYPISHGSRYVFARHQFLTFPFERKVNVEDFKMPIRHISQLIDEC